MSEDLEFVRLCVCNDKNAWDKFVQRYSRLIYNYILSVFHAKRVLRTHQEYVKDIYQDIFKLLKSENFRKLRTFKGKNGCSLASWLRQVVVNYTLEFLRKEKILLSLDEENDEGLCLGNTISADVPSASELAEQKEKMRKLAECFERLDLNEKLFLELHFNQDLQAKELSLVFKTSRSAIDMRKRRILEKLRECFRQKGYVLEL